MNCGSWPGWLQVFRYVFMLEGEYHSLEFESGSTWNTSPKDKPLGMYFLMKFRVRLFFSLLPPQPLPYLLN